jgi:hypothetical protein
MSAAGRVAAWDTRRLWSLRDVLEISAAAYMALGAHLERAVAVFEDVEDIVKRPFGRMMEEPEQTALRGALTEALEECKKLRLPVSSTLLESYVDAVEFMSGGQLNVLIQAVQTELSTQSFMFMPSPEARYYNLEIPQSLRVTFPTVSQELIMSGEALGCGLYIASVFHAMRGAEIGVRVLGRALGVTFPDKPIDLAEWHQILDQCDAKIRLIGQQPKSAQRDADQQFYSAAASQFRYFKDGWRVRVAHARAVYQAKDAIRVLDHVLDFFDGLAPRLSEDSP